MNIRDQLNEIKIYYELTRPSNHTTAMLNGVKQSNSSIIIVHNLSYSKEIKKELPYPEKVVFSSIHSTNGLRGHKQPLFIDHIAMWELCRAAIDEIDRLKSKCGEK